jgi:hypothetical protein
MGLYYENGKESKHIPEAFACNVYNLLSLKASLSLSALENVPLKDFPTFVN